MDWHAALARALEREAYFTRVRPNPFLAALAKDTARVCRARIAGKFDVPTIHASQLPR